MENPYLNTVQKLLTETIWELLYGWSVITDHPVLYYTIIYKTTHTLQLNALYTSQYNSIGPWDVGMTKDLRPQSIRGQFAETNVRSAIHCTDLPTDGIIECEHCFRIISQ